MDFPARLYILHSDRYCLHCLVSNKCLVKWYKETFEKKDIKIEQNCDGSYEVDDIIKDVNENCDDWNIQEVWFDDIDVWDEDGTLNII